MPGPARLFLCTLALASLAARSAGAFVALTDEVNGKLISPRWPAGALPIPFVMNDRPLSLLPNLTRASVPQAAVEAAMRTWSLAPVSMYLDGTTTTADFGIDGMNLVTLANTAKNRDYTGNAWARTMVLVERQGEQARIIETDVVVNPKMSFTTEGTPNVRDLQDILTHELGHALGLDHSPIANTTMYPFSGVEGIASRTLEADDVAGLRYLYGGGGETPVGAITGKVLTTDNGAIFGAHVVATDTDGIARVGSLSARDGSFTIRSLPPGDYQVYAEPLDGPVTPADILGAFHSARKSFGTAFAGGNDAPATVHVAAGQTTGIDPIRVEGKAATLNVEFITLTASPTSFRGAANGPLQIAAGKKTYLAIMGAGLSGVPRNGFSASGADVVLDTSRVGRGTAGSLAFVILPISVRSGAVPGARNLYVASSTERAAFTGCVEVVSP
jgi:matrixin/carboxypeptidase family protein